MMDIWGGRGGGLIATFAIYFWEKIINGEMVKKSMAKMAKIEKMANGNEPSTYWTMDIQSMSIRHVHVHWTSMSIRCLFATFVPIEYDGHIGQIRPVDKLDIIGWLLYVQ